MIVILLLIVGCYSKGTDDNYQEKQVDKSLYDTVRVAINLLNEQTDEYYVFLVAPGKIGTKGAPTSVTDFYGPIEVENFKGEIDLKYNNKIEYLLDELDEKKLQLVVTTHEDY